MNFDLTKSSMMKGRSEVKRCMEGDNHCCRASNDIPLVGSIKQRYVAFGLALTWAIHADPSICKAIGYKTFAFHFRVIFNGLDLFPRCRDMDGMHGT